MTTHVNADEKKNSATTAVFLVLNDVKVFTHRLD